MNKYQILNIASDLRRSANWLGRGQKEKRGSIMNIINEANNQKEVGEILKHFKVRKNLKSNLLAENLLTASIRLKNMASNF